jgi:hypothetical protein
VKNIAEEIELIRQEFVGRSIPGILVQESLNDRIRMSQIALSVAKASKPGVDQSQVALGHRENLAMSGRRPGHIGE